MVKSKLKFIQLICGLLFVLVSSCAAPLIESGKSVHLAMGNPSNATADVANADNYLMIKQGYVLSYNNGKGIPNWVSWQLNRSWMGKSGRTNAWSPDPSLPGGWHKIQPGDYDRSGYDRGHMTPSNDRTKNTEINNETFLMTNILPQAADNNRRTWEHLESYSRDLVARGKELYIISGGIGQKGTIANGKASVPERVWKVIVVLDKPGLGASGVTMNTRAIAVDIPNSNGISSDWRDFRTSIARLEDATGYNFLSNVPFLTQLVIEAKVDGSKRLDLSNRTLAALGVTLVVLCSAIFAIAWLFKKRYPRRNNYV